MANFNGIVRWVLQQEDRGLTGKVVDLGDGQGLTRFGIAQNAHPNLPDGFYTEPPAIALLTAEEIYRGDYWNRFSGDLINSDQVASCLMSFAINDGTAREVKMLQECLGVTVDGIMGPTTLAQTNAYNSTLLAAALRTYQADWYRNVAATNPADIKYLDGWLARAARIYPSLV